MNKTNNYELNLPSGNDIIDIDVLDKNFEIIDRLLKSIESKNHTHDNLTTLNDITATHVSQWDTAWSYSHTHSNKGALDNITQSKIDSWDKAWYNEHTHSNKSILDKITQSMIDTWNAAAGAEVDLSAYALKTDLHEHENKSVLDGITQGTLDNLAMLLSHIEYNSTTKKLTIKSDGDLLIKSPNRISIEADYDVEACNQELNVNTIRDVVDIRFGNNTTILTENDVIDLLAVKDKVKTLGSIVDYTDLTIKIDKVTESDGQTVFTVSSASGIWQLEGAAVTSDNVGARLGDEFDGVMGLDITVNSDKSIHFALDASGAAMLNISAGGTFTYRVYYTQ